MRKALLVVLVAVLVGAAASVQAAVNPVVAALAKTAKAKTSVVSLSGVVSSGVEKVALRGRIEQQGTSAHMKMTIDSPLGPQAIEMIALTERGRYVIYMKSPAFLQQLPPGKKWIRLDATRSAQALGLDLSSFTQASPESLAGFERAIVATKRLGAASVAGEPATHYLVHVDLVKAAAGQPAIAASLTRLAGAGIKLKRFPLHLWVGKDGRVRQLRQTLTVRTGGQRVSTSLTFRYVALDTPVRIGAPPRSQVVDA